MRDPKTSMKGYADERVTVMIGQDVPQTLIPLEVRYGGNDESYDVRTVLGWTVNDFLGAKCIAEEAVSNFNHTADLQLDKMVETLRTFKNSQIV